MSGDALQRQGTSSDNSFAGFVIAGPGIIGINMNGAGVTRNIYMRFTLLSSSGDYDLLGDYNSNHQIFQSLAVYNSGNQGIDLGSPVGKNLFAVGGR